MSLFPYYIEIKFDRTTGPLRLQPADCSPEGYEIMGLFAVDDSEVDGCYEEIEYMRKLVKEGEFPEPERRFTLPVEPEPSRSLLEAKRRHEDALPELKVQRRRAEGGRVAGTSSSHSTQVSTGRSG